MLQYGQYDDHEFYGFSMSSAQPSSWINWPTEDKPSNKYKYASIEFNMSSNIMNWNRTTYSILDWLGDLGGLFGMLFSLASLAVAPMANY